MKVQIADLTTTTSLRSVIPREGVESRPSSKVLVIPEEGDPERGS